MKKEQCHICKKEFEVEDYITEPACPECFNGCSEPGYHRGKKCDGSC
jgi:hypothetical protein